MGFYGSTTNLERLTWYCGFYYIWTTSGNHFREGLKRVYFLPKGVSNSNNCSPKSFLILGVNPLSANILLKCFSENSLMAMWLYPSVQPKPRVKIYSQGPTKRSVRIISKLHRLTGHRSNVSHLSLQDSCKASGTHANDSSKHTHFSRDPGMNNEIMVDCNHCKKQQDFRRARFDRPSSNDSPN